MMSWHISTTYARGKYRINFILTDSAIVPTIERIGTMGLHEEIVTKTYYAMASSTAPSWPHCEDLLLNMQTSAKRSSTSSVSMSRRRTSQKESKHSQNLPRGKVQTTTILNASKCLIPRLLSEYSVQQRRQQKRSVDTNAHQFSHARALPSISGRQHCRPNPAESNWSTANSTRLSVAILTLARCIPLPSVKFEVKSKNPDLTFGRFRKIQQGRGHNGCKPMLRTLLEQQARSTCRTVWKKCSD